MGKARGRPERLGAEAIHELGALYRAVVADYAQARRIAPRDPVTSQLEALAVEARRLVYSTVPPSRRARHFFGHGYWALIRERPGHLAVAAALLLLPAVLVGVWAVIDPVATRGLVPPEFRSVLTPGAAGTDQGMTVGQQVAFSGFLITHNIQVSILAFAYGIAVGVGTAYVLVMNGMILGAIGGGLVAAGEGPFFLELVAAHGVLELSAVVVVAAAGLRIGWAIVEPGRRSRRDALVAEAKEAVMVVLGTMPWFVLAGFIEAFVSRRGSSAAPMVIVGVVVGALFWSLVARRTAVRPGGHSRARRFAFR